MTAEFSVIAFISGRGSNFQNLVTQARDFKVTGVVCDRKDAAGLKFAAEQGIPSYIFDRSDFLSRKEARAAMLTKVRELNPSLIVLAGFMQILTPDFIATFDGKIVNIHPSLLPKYPGLDTHKRALEGGESEHGCTVHFVDTGVDTGPIIAQASCPCEPGDTPDTLAHRVLSLEHKLYPWVVNHLAQGEISLQSNTSSPSMTRPAVTFSEKVKQEALEKGFLLPK